MKNTPVIILKKRKSHGHGHHGGAWKVAYADFVTAMMAFFLVLWIVGQSQAVKNSVAGYFRDPGVFEFERSTGVLPGATTGISPEGPPSLKQVAVRSAADREALEKKAATLKAMLDKRPELAGMRDQVEIQMTRDGLRIELIEKSDSLFFDSGSAALKAHTVRLLQAIAQELASLDNPIVLEGHTDSRRYTASGTYTNWELAADRANAARRVMDGVLPAGRLSEVRGYADTRLRFPADPLDPRNRRVSIIVGNHEAEAAPARDVLNLPAAVPQAPPATH